MKNKKRNMILAISLSAALAAALAGCGTAAGTSSEGNTSVEIATVSTTPEQTETTTTTTAAVSSGGAIDAVDLFTERDLEQSADLSEAVSKTISDGETYEITTAGVYVISGTASDAQIVVDAGDEDKVQIVLDGVSITNSSIPCIYVKNADKVFVTTTDSTNSLSVTGTFTEDGDTKTDAVIFSKDDLVLNGTGTLKIESSDNAVACKDDLKITGGTYKIYCADAAFEANDSIAIADGSITITQ